MSLLDPSTGATSSLIQASADTDSAKAESAAALVELSGASSMAVDDYLISVPPDMAAATTLVNELSTIGSISYAAASSVYTLLDSSAALALTSN